MPDNKIIIISTGWRCEEYKNRCIQSVDDNKISGGVEQYIIVDGELEKRKGKAFNFLSALALASPSPNDIICDVDLIETTTNTIAPELEGILTKPALSDLKLTCLSLVKEHACEKCNNNLINEKHLMKFGTKDTITPEEFESFCNRFIIESKEDIKRHQEKFKDKKLLVNVMITCDVYPEI